jgi:hypothetical protein
MSPYKSEDVSDDDERKIATTSAPLSEAGRIRELNDAFRKSFIGGRVLVTPGVRELSPEANAALLEAVRSFGDFTKDNDPYWEKRGQRALAVLVKSEISRWAPIIKATNIRWSKPRGC